MYVAGILMQLCCGALMWAGQGGCSKLYYCYYRTERISVFVFPHCCRHTKDCTDREGDLPGGRVCVSLAID